MGGLFNFLNVFKTWYIQKYMGETLFASDLHGHINKYARLRDFALSNDIESIILGGDLAPNEIFDYIKTQKRFLSTILPEILRPLENKIPIYAILGNDDCKTNLTYFERTFINQIDNNRMKLNDDFEIVGYSTVPITPFGIKDWEKYDLAIVLDEVKGDYQNRIRDYNLKGFKSNQWGFNQYNLEKYDLDTIQFDLERGHFVKDPEKTIYVMHSPPNNTNLDVLLNKGHAGSFAIKDFIEDYQPHLTLHGHIHETVDMTGKFKEKIGNSISMAAGSSTDSNNLPILLIDLYDPKKTKRIIL